MSFRRMRHIKAREVQGCTLALDAGRPSMYNATSGGSLVAADGAIWRWEDQSGNGNHVTNATGAEQPARKVSEANGYGSASFDGGDFLNSASGAYSVFFSADANTVIAAVKQAGTKAQNALVSASPGGASSGFLFWATFSDTIYFDAPATSARVSVAQPDGWDDAYNIVTGWRNAGTALIRANAKQLLSQTGKTGSLSYTNAALQVGATATGGTYKFQGHISLLSVYPRALSDVVTARLEHSMMRKTRIKSA